MSKVLVGTYRPENEEWIKKQHLYNLPIIKDGDENLCKDFEYVVLYSENRMPIVHHACYLSVVEDEVLKNTGYAISSDPHGKKYALFMLTDRLSTDAVLGNGTADVFICSTRFTRKIEKDFYDHLPPDIGSDSISNIFRKLRPFVSKWHSLHFLCQEQGELFTREQLAPKVIPPRKGAYTAVELFAGAGGLSIGLERAGINVVIANEIMPDFAATLRANHPNTNVINDDIHKIDFKEELRRLGLTSVDVLSGGPPCQGFSTIGSKNRKDPRNSLFYEYLRAVSEVKPKYTIFENVAGFKRMYDGFAYETLVKELGELGYETECRILNAADYGAPQVRYRTIVLGWKRGLKPLVFPKPTHGTMKGLKPYRTLMDAISDLPELSAGQAITKYGSEPLNDYQARMRGEQQELLEHNASNYGEKMQEILKIVPVGGSIKDLPDYLRPKSGYANTYARLLPDVPCTTITRNFGTPSSSRCIHPYQPRALSTREGARIQGFPDDYKFVGGKQSKNLQIGNAVPPILSEAIAKQIREALDDKD